MSLLLVPGLIQAAALLATVAALRIVDRAGRRVVLLTGIGAMMVANALLIAVFAASLGAGSSVLAFLGVLLFICGFDFGFGALVWVYASESFPARLRTTGVPPARRASSSRSSPLNRIRSAKKGRGGAPAHARAGGN